MAWPLKKCFYTTLTFHTTLIASKLDRRYYLTFCGTAVPSARARLILILHRRESAGDETIKINEFVLAAFSTEFTPMERKCMKKYIFHILNVLFTEKLYAIHVLIWDVHERYIWECVENIYNFHVCEKYRNNGSDTKYETRTPVESARKQFNRTHEDDTRLVLDATVR